MELKTIDDVIDELGNIIKWSEENNSRLGYFPALYRMVTIRVKEGIAAGELVGKLRDADRTRYRMG